MLMAAEEIADITARGRAAFDHDVALRRAVERCLEIVGAASKSVSPQLHEQYPDVAWADMAKIRDRLSHHYHRIDPGPTVGRRRDGRTSPGRAVATDQASRPGLRWPLAHICRLMRGPRDPGCRRRQEPDRRRHPPWRSGERVADDRVEIGGVLVVIVLAVHGRDDLEVLSRLERDPSGVLQHE